MPTLVTSVWSKDKRFKRIGENSGGHTAKGGFGTVFQGFDELTQRNVFIKRQDSGGNAAARETACYNMLEAFKHPNIIEMYGIWTAPHKNKNYLYIAMEACSTTLWYYIGVDNPIAARNFKPTGGPEAIYAGVLAAARHLHDRGVTHGDLSLSNVLISPSGEPKLADFGTMTAHTIMTEEKLSLIHI